MTTGMKHLAAYQANLLDYNAAKDRECNYIGNQIRAARKSMKLSLEQLSQILMGYGVDIGRVAVNKWEKGISIPSAYQLLAVCAALHLEDGFDYFVSNTKRPLLNAEGRRKVKEYREDLIASGKYREVPPSGHAGQRPAGIRWYRRISGRGKLRNGQLSGEQHPRWCGIWRSGVWRQHGACLS